MPRGDAAPHDLAVSPTERRRSPNVGHALSRAWGEGSWSERIQTASGRHPCCAAISLRSHYGAEIAALHAYGKRKDRSASLQNGALRGGSAPRRVREALGRWPGSWLVRPARDSPLSEILRGEVAGEGRDRARAHRRVSSDDAPRSLSFVDPYVVVDRSRVGTVDSDVIYPSFARSRRCAQVLWA